MIHPIFVEMLLFNLEEKKNRLCYYEMSIRKVKSLSCIQLFATPWTVACQAPLSVGFSRQEYWSGLPFPSPGIFLTQGSNRGLLDCRQILYHLSHQESPGANFLTKQMLVTKKILDTQELSELVI